MSTENRLSAPATNATTQAEQFSLNYERVRPVYLEEAARTAIDDLAPIEGEAEAFLISLIAPAVQSARAQLDQPALDDFATVAQEIASANTLVSDAAFGRSAAVGEHYAETVASESAHAANSEPQSLEAAGLEVVVAASATDDRPVQDMSADGDAAAAPAVRITITVKHGIAPPEEADDLAAEPGAEPPQDDAQPADRFMFVEADARPVVGGADGFAIEKGRGGPDDFVNAPAAPDIEGTSAGEILSGTAEGEAIWGYAGDDIIAGLGGDDELRGGLGDDTIFGGEGDDLIGGFLGTDELTGGAGADGFLFQDVDTDYQDIGVDIITDFDLAEDYLVFAEDFFAGGGALADNLIALQGVGGVELYADSAISGLVQIAFLEGVDAAAMQALIANESILG